MNKIEQYLLEKGIKPNLKGFVALENAIKLCGQDRLLLDGITTKLYPEVARLTNDTISKVERAIRHALLRANIPMTNKEFIALAFLELKGVRNA